ncbi:MAG TPA: hypothetical protein VKY22_09335 [Bradyrhizobium sp.]|nr:hypothetical protein [Bradyrhizobium sp.]
MSIPARQNETQSETDERLLYAVPWASDLHREEETNRLQQAVIEAAQRLGREPVGPSLQAAAQSQRPSAVGFRLATPLSRGPSSEESSQQSDQDNDPQNDLEEMNRRIWAGLMPKFIAPPPREPLSLPGLGVTTGLVGAVFVAAAVALVVVNVVQIPVISSSSDDDVRRVQSSPRAAPGHLTRIAAVEARIAAETRTGAADIATVPAGTLLAAVPTNDIAAAPKSAPAMTQPPAALLPAPQPSQEVELMRPEIAPPKAAPAPEPRPSVTLTRPEIASLLRRGQDLIAAGDIASARLVLTHVAEAGDAEASLILAGTYDPAVLGTRRGVGVQGDPAKARAWYARAAEQGSTEARRRLDRLGQSALR